MPSDPFEIQSVIGPSPSLKKARELAKVLRLASGYFCLPKPPQDGLPIPDFRRLGKEYRPTAEFLELLKDVLVRQDSYREYLKESGRAKPELASAPRHSWTQQLGVSMD